MPDPGRPAPMHLRHLLVIAVLLAAGCRRGYVVDIPNNRVTFQTWDEGNGTLRFPVRGADAATFEAFVPRDIAFRLLDRVGWARDDRAYYWYGRELPEVAGP